MTSARLIPLLLAVLVFVGGCTKDPSSVGPNGAEAVVEIHASVGNVSAVTKAGFANESTYGIFTCVQGTSDKFLPSLWNVKARLAGATWRYHYVADYATGAVYADDASSDKFVLQGRKDNKAADLYAYAPFVPAAYGNAYGPTAIPFSREMDVMYAAQNPSNANGGMDPAGLSPLSAAFDFQRLMACLEFDFTLDTPNNTAMSIALVSIKDNDPSGGAVLYTGGTFNAITGQFNQASLTAAEELTSSLGSCTVVNDNTAAPNLGHFSFTLVPTEVVTDGELVFTFQSGGHILPPFVLERAQVMHDDGITCGFQAGYKYVFHFTLDNYVRFRGFDIRPWGEAGELTDHGVI